MVPQDYDSIIRENILKLYIPLIQKLTGIDLQKVKNELIEQDLNKTVQRKVDFVRKIFPKNEKPYLLHVEFQSSNSPEMLWRMAEYFIKFTRTYQLPVKQYVVYIGNKKMSMKDTIKLGNFNYAYTLINIKSLSYKDFIASNSAEEVIFAILTDFENQSSETIIQKIFKRIEELEKDPLRFGKYVNQLEILSKTRKLQKVINQKINNMPIEYDLKTDIRFLQGKEVMREEVEKAQKRAEQERQKAEQIAQQAEQKVEKAEQKVEQIAQQAEQKVEKAEQKVEKAIIGLLKEGMTIKKVAQLTGSSTYKVQKIKKGI